MHKYPAFLLSLVLLSQPLAAQSVIASKDNGYGYAGYWSAYQNGAAKQPRQTQQKFIPNYKQPVHEADKTRVAAPQYDMKYELGKRLAEELDPKILALGGGWKHYRRAYNNANDNIYRNLTPFDAEVLGYYKGKVIGKLFEERPEYKKAIRNKKIATVCVVLAVTITVAVIATPGLLALGATDAAFLTSFGTCGAITATKVASAAFVANWAAASGVIAIDVMLTGAALSAFEDFNKDMNDYIARNKDMRAMLAELQPVQACSVSLDKKTAPNIPDNWAGYKRQHIETLEVLAKMDVIQEELRKKNADRFNAAVIDIGDLYTGKILRPRKEVYGIVRKVQEDKIRKQIEKQVNARINSREVQSSADKYPWVGSK